MNDSGLFLYPSPPPKRFRVAVSEPVLKDEVLTCYDCGVKHKFVMSEARNYCPECGVHYTRNCLE